MMRSLFKKYFLTGVLVLVPLAASVAVLYWLVMWIARKLQFGIIPTSVILEHVPETLHGPVEIALKFSDIGLSLIIVLVAILIAGAIARNYIGKKTISFGENLIEKVPLMGMIYKAVKQLTETIFTIRGNFSRVVMIEYPRPGSWCLAFVSRESAELFNEKTGERMLNLFVPTTPNPTSGYLLMIPESQCIDADISIEEAFEVIISGGIIHPARKSIPAGAAAAPVLKKETSDVKDEHELPGGN
jgi:uncharacterized membrane protein